MLELIGVYFLCRKCSRTARDKGYAGGWFGFLAAALWFGFEFIGALAAAFLTQQTGAVIYIFALMGAGAGALIAWLIARNLPDRTPAEPVATQSYQLRDVIPISQPGHAQAPAWCNRCGHQLLPGSKYCEKCGTPVIGLKQYD